ncbi:hypothetical protein Scep_023583 [Stephania cephalantha]|uniref:Uncharacterized protein n=1 Tax=Stephania cephalantha TaxID=152367 RepID=A0AAP0HSX3_9MAGN
MGETTTARLRPTRTTGARSSQVQRRAAAAWRLDVDEERRIGGSGGVSAAGSRRIARGRRWRTDRRGDTGPRTTDCAAAQGGRDTAARPRTMAGRSERSTQQPKTSSGLVAAAWTGSATTTATAADLRPARGGPAAPGVGAQRCRLNGNGGVAREERGGGERWGGGRQRDRAVEETAACDAAAQWRAVRGRRAKQAPASSSGGAARRWIAPSGRRMINGGVDAQQRRGDDSGNGAVNDAMTLSDRSEA